MIKGILLSVLLASFVTSLVLIISNSKNVIQENIITGNFVGYSGIASYSLISLIASFILCCLVIFWMKNSFS